MAGLRKAKKYDWKDSNMALFGSKLERDVKKASAMTEPAWEGAGQEEGIQIWRIVKFQVTHWPKDQYGEFYEGDSYIILKTTKKKKGDGAFKGQQPSGEGDGGNLDLHVHFWIGKYSTQDEYGTVAYKTVELDTLLDDRAVQHREVQGYESALFKSYFDSIILLKGGAETGFRHVTPEVYEPRLLHFCGSRRTMEVKEVPLSRQSLRSDDVYILDLGREIYQWNGRGSSKDERFKAMSFLSQLKVERVATSETLEEDMLHSEHKFYTSLKECVDQEDDSDDEEGEEILEKTLFKLSDLSGKLAMTKEKTGDVTWDDMKSEDTFLLFHTNLGVFVWIGSGASTSEKKRGFEFGHNFLHKNKRCYLPITVVRQGQDSADLLLAMSA